MNVSLTPTLEKYVQAKVKSGRYGSASEVVRNAIRALQVQEKEQAARLKQLRTRIERGLTQAEAGEGVPAEQVFADLRPRTRARNRRRKAA